MDLGLASLSATTSSVAEGAMMMMMMMMELLVIWNYCFSRLNATKILPDKEIYRELPWWDDYWRGGPSRYRLLLSDPFNGNSALAGILLHCAD